MHSGPASQYFISSVAFKKKFKLNKNLVIFKIKKERNELSSHDKTWRKLKCIFLREGSQSEKAPYSVSSLNDVWGRQNCADKKTGGYQVLGRGRGVDRAPGPFSAETRFCMTVGVSIRRGTCAQTCRM